MSLRWADSNQSEGQERAGTRISPLGLRACEAGNGWVRARLPPSLLQHRVEPARIEAVHALISDQDDRHAFSAELLVFGAAARRLFYIDVFVRNSLRRQQRP